MEEDQFRRKLKERRIALHLTLEDVAKYVGVTKATVQRWESGEIGNLRRDRIAKLAQIMQYSPSELMGWEDKSEKNNFDVFSIPGILPIPKMKKVPRLGSIACGTPILAEQNIETFDDISENIQCDFALQCKGDSMTGARIMNGDIVFIRQQPEVENGEIAAVLIGEEATLKRVYKHDHSLVLQAENPAYPPMVYSGNQLEEVRILGKAVWFKSMVR